MTREEAVQEMESRARDIVTVDLAQRIAAAFSQDVRSLGLVSEYEAGLDFGAGREVWDAGEGVDIDYLAFSLAEQMGCPQIDYPTDYMGAGKRAEAVTIKSCLRLRMHVLGQELDRCVDCGSLNFHYQLDDQSVICHGCSVDRRRKDAFCFVRMTIWKDGSTLNKKDMTGQVTCEVYEKYIGELRPEKGWFPKLDLDKALALAYKTNRSKGLIGPVEVCERF